jgi:predicted CopG family antitoxin
MVKTLTIRDSVYNKLVARKTKDESFSELFERLLEGSTANAVETLAKLRGSVEFKRDSKAALLSEIGTKRSERRSHDRA